MGRPIKSAPDCLLAFLIFASAGCGGGSSTSRIPPPPPPSPDFSIGFSSSSINVEQGATSSPVILSVNSLNGFNGTVQITLTDLPAGVIRSEEHTSELQSHVNLVCRLLLE